MGYLAPVGSDKIMAYSTLLAPVHTGLRLQQLVYDTLTKYFPPSLPP